MPIMIKFIPKQLHFVNFNIFVNVLSTFLTHKKVAKNASATTLYYYNMY